MESLDLIFIAENGDEISFKEDRLKKYPESLLSVLAFNLPNDGIIETKFSTKALMELQFFYNNDFWDFYSHHEYTTNKIFCDDPNIKVDEDFFVNFLGLPLITKEYPSDLENDSGFIDPGDEYDDGCYINEYQSETDSEDYDDYDYLDEDS